MLLGHESLETAQIALNLPRDNVELAFSLPVQVRHSSDQRLPLMDHILGTRTGNISRQRG